MQYKEMSLLKHAPFPPAHCHHPNPPSRTQMETVGKVSYWPWESSSSSPCCASSAHSIRPWRVLQKEHQRDYINNCWLAMSYYYGRHSSKSQKCLHMAWMLMWSKQPQLPICSHTIIAQLLIDGKLLLMQPLQHGSLRFQCMWVSQP